MKLSQENIKRIYKLAGADVHNNKGESLGFVAGTLIVSENKSSQENPDYIVLGTDSIDESSTKYFAVPAHTKLIDMSDPDSSITAMLTEENLVRAKRISVDKCPMPFGYEPLIYELTDFAVDQKESTG